MADAVDQKVLRTGGRYHVVHRTCDSDGTGETAQVVVDLSALLDVNGRVPTWSVVDRVEYSVWGFDHVLLAWDHTTDDEIARLAGQGVLDWTQVGGKPDPKTSGATGDIILTSPAGATTGGYDITIYCRLKAEAG